MADTQMAGRFDTEYLDRHNDRISVYMLVDDAIIFTDGAEAVNDLVLRMPDTTTPQDVVRLIGHVIGELQDYYCRLGPGMEISTTCPGEPIKVGILRIAKAYLAVDRIDVEEVLARE